MSPNFFTSRGSESMLEEQSETITFSGKSFNDLHATPSIVSFITICMYEESSVIFQSFIEGYFLKEISFEDAAMLTS